MRIRPAFLAVLVSFSLGIAGPASSSPAETYAGGYYGIGHVPPACIVDETKDKVCNHQKAELNGLDSPIVDITLLAPASPTAERDLRIAKQAVQSWQGGIHYLAGQMGLDWLRDGVKFHITADVVDLSDPAQALTSLADPEIVVLVSNPAGATGIGIDPWNLATPLLTVDDGQGQPCFSQTNPFDFATWSTLPGFDQHHAAQAGTYVEDCGGVGGNVCFSINGAVDPLPGVTEVQALYDIVQHESGHCLSLGHVGDANDFVSPVVPNFDIMSYSKDRAGRPRCASTLDVETFAIRMSRYLDVNGDGKVTFADRLMPSGYDAYGMGMHVQDPADYALASPTGSVWDCPRPDLGLLPGATPPRYDPTPVRTRHDVLTLTSPKAGSTNRTGRYWVRGTAAQVLNNPPTTATSAAATDPADDATSPLSELVGVAVKVTTTEVTAVVKATQLAPAGTVVTPSYSVIIGGRDIESYLDEQQRVHTYDWSEGETELPGEWSVWDTAANTVTFHIPRTWLAARRVTAPYGVYAASATGIASSVTSPAFARDDRVPDTGFMDVTGSPVDAPVNDDPAATTPLPSFEHVTAYVDGREIATREVRTSHGMTTFSIPITLTRGVHRVKVVWDRRGAVVATAVRKVSRH